LKNPTYTLNGMNIRKKDLFRSRRGSDWESGVLETPDDAAGGVGGFAGMKKDGIVATEDCSD
jgi:hypothetical protein